MIRFLVTSVQKWYSPPEAEAAPAAEVVAIEARVEQSDNGVPTIGAELSA